MRGSSLFISLITIISALQERRFPYPGILAFAATADVAGNDADKQSLLSFKSLITEDPSNALSSWNESSHFCTWSGVACASKIRRVARLYLHGCNLVGTITPHLGNLSSLTLLDLSENLLHGNIPSELGKLAGLQVLNMSYNLLEGWIPGDLSNCTNLRNLALDRNKLTGTVPPVLGSITKLLSLHLQSNKLSGTVPSSVGNLTSLQELRMSYNFLNGEVPNTVSQLKKLKTFGLAVNNLTGEFPPSLYNLTSLTVISVCFNNLTGYLRPDIGRFLPNLQRLELCHNFFTGTIPDSLANATKLQRIDLGRNNFTGKVPQTLAKLDLLYLSIQDNRLGRGQPDDLDFIVPLTNCSNLRVLLIGENGFGGVLPLSIVNLSTKLTLLYLGINMIQGCIPRDISNLKSISTLIMTSNLLNGSIPDSIGMLPTLVELRLDSNELTGKIPSSIGNLTRLSWLDLHNNSLEGKIPATLENCKELEHISVSRNNLIGIIPPGVIGKPSLLWFYVQYNYLTGPLPRNVGNSSKLAKISLSHNRFSGEIPENLGQCLALTEIVLYENLFYGKIPDLSKLHSLNYLDLSSNNLSGNIPDFLASLPSFVYLNLSFNNLYGPVPSKGVFLNASAVAIRANPNLCGEIPELHLHACREEEPHKTSGEGRQVAWIKRVLIIGSTTFIGVLSLLILVICWIRKRPKMLANSSSFGSLKFFPKNTYQELQRATDGFSSENLIGSGSFGTVYKGILNSMTVAVKVLNLRHEGAAKSFMSECQALRNIRHHNLVKVITACSSSDFQGNDFKALVYQYMPNGSLDMWLHPDQDAPGRFYNLSIIQRMDIAIDIAAALNYLHHQCQKPVIHCDLKPQNVLLDDDMNACVGDFGLARLVTTLGTKEYTSQFSSLGVKGTVGYAAPEYGMGAQVSILGDVYSFGILLLEIVTGERPTDSTFIDNLNLHHFVNLAIPKRVHEILDSSALCQELTGNARTWNEGWSKLTLQQREGLTNVVRIGVACSCEWPEDRLSMSEVYQELTSVRVAFP